MDLCVHTSTQPSVLQQSPYFTLLKEPSKNGVNCGKWLTIHYEFREIENT
jgi:hypothetical protein